LNFAISGVPYWTMDIGGFCVEKRYESEDPAHVDEWRELNTRWFQFGAFCPLFRSHGQFPYREVYNLAPESTEYYQSLVYYTKLRYRLMPYIYSLAGMTYYNDYTIMRPMVMDFAADTNVRNLGDQYMFGPSLLVAPVYQFKARTRKVYLPKGKGWYDFNSGVYFDGGQTVDAAAPLLRMPMFVKEGAILPYGPDIQYTAQKSDEPTTILVYTGANGSFNLYEDEGVNYNYEKGHCSNIKLTYDEASKTLTIGKRNGTFEGMQQARQFKVVFIEKGKPSIQKLDITSGKIIDYSGDELTVRNEQQY